ncbi:MAG: amidohydrolase family protein [Erysipelotrichaceae bacterium]|nr:amidohydrolase family protein [Erysipelotrichaceae bacterium]
MIIKNGLVFIDGAYHRVDVEVKGSVITRIAENIEGEDIYDAAGKYVFAGFIESHIHGGFGYNCGESVEATQAISAQLPQFGVTSYFPTPVEKPTVEETRLFVNNIRNAKGGPGADILGIFLYANFRNRSIAYYKPATLPLKEHFNELLDNDFTDIKMCLLAPELPLGLEFIQYLTSLGIMPVIGYSEGDREIIHKAVALGARLTDHFPNGMPVIDHHISQSIVGCYLEDDLYMQINCDCIHVDKDYIRMMFKLKGADHLVAVSDNNAMSNYPEGTYEMGGRTVIIKDGAIRDPGGKLVSGAHSFDENMRTMLKNGFSREEIGLIFSENAARALNIKDRGKIEAGRRSDLVIMDDGFNVVKTMIGGKWFFEK